MFDPHQYWRYTHPSSEDGPGGVCVEAYSLLSPMQVAAAGAFAQTLRRYTSLNHLAQAARAVLQNTAQINQMLSDLNRVDFANVQVSTIGAGTGGSDGRDG